MKQPIMWTKTHEKVKRNLRKWLIFTNLFWIVIVSLVFYPVWLQRQKGDPEIFAIKQQIKEYKAKDEIFNILRVKGISLSQGMDIANALIVHARENKIPLELGLSIMKQESRFHINAISNRGAKGLMQLMPDTFDSYNKAFKMGLSKQAIFDPIVNIKISFLHLRDLMEDNGNKVKSDEELWEKVLVAYSGGAAGYAKTVKKYRKDFEKLCRSN